jgi:hypothetical protein
MVGRVNGGHPASDASVPRRFNPVRFRANGGSKPHIDRGRAFIDEVLDHDDGTLPKADFGFVDAPVAVDDPVESRGLVVEP